MFQDESNFPFFDFRDMEMLKTTLGDTLNMICQEMLTFTTALHYESLIGVTVNEETTLVFTLRGIAGSVVCQILLQIIRIIHMTFWI